MTAAAHSVYSPSAAKRWLSCPASIRLTNAAKERGLLDDNTSPYALSGTAAMAVLEEMLRAPGAAYEEAFVAAMALRQDAAEGFRLIDNDDSRRAICKAAERLRALVRNADLWGVEERVVISDGDPLIWGTADFWALTDACQTLTVVDYKHGAGYLISAEGNQQLLLYAAGLMRNHLHNYPIRKVRLAICQPRHPEASADGWDEVEEDPAFVRAFMRAVLDRLEQAANEPPVTGEHCQYCPALLACPARRAEFEELVTMAETVAPEQADAEMIAKAVRMKKRVTDWIAAAERVGLKMIQAGAEVPGLRTRTRAGALAWTASDSEVIAALSQFVPEDEIKSVSVLTPTQVIDKFGDVAGVREAVEKLAQRKPSHLYLTAD
jgi:hypothetical protein